MYDKFYWQWHNWYDNNFENIVYVIGFFSVVVLFLGIGTIIGMEIRDGIRRRRANAVRRSRTVMIGKLRGRSAGRRL